jgi:hypothetical protein
MDGTLNTISGEISENSYKKESMIAPNEEQNKSKRKYIKKKDKQENENAIKAAKIMKKEEKKKDKVPSTWHDINVTMKLLVAMDITNLDNPHLTIKHASDSFYMTFMQPRNEELHFSCIIGRSTSRRSVYLIECAVLAGIILKKATIDFIIQ